MKSTLPRYQIRAGFFASFREKVCDRIDYADPIAQLFATTQGRICHLSETRISIKNGRTIHKVTKDVKD